MLLPRTLSNPVSSAARRILVPQKKKTGMKRISHAKSVKSKSVSFIGYCETAALCSTGKKGRNKVGKQLHPSLYAHTRGWYGTKYVGSVRRSQLEVMARKWVLATAKTKADYLLAPHKSRPPRRWQVEMHWQGECWKDPHRERWGEHCQNNSPDESAIKEIKRGVWMYTMTTQKYMKAER